MPNSPIATAISTNTLYPLVAMPLVSLKDRGHCPFSGGMRFSR
jgi:hypothetical protein